MDLARPGEQPGDDLFLAIGLSAHEGVGGGVYSQALRLAQRLRRSGRVSGRKDGLEVDEREKEGRLLAVSLLKTVS